MEAQKQRRRVLTLAHLADARISASGPSAERLGRALERLAALPERPDFILGGGDMILDGLASPRARVKADWDALQTALRAAPRFEWRHCLGNHDVFGWDHAASGATGEESVYGKAWALDELGMERRYYSFDRAGWHFIVLDSVHAWGQPGGGLTQAMLDILQFEWLVGDLAGTPGQTPVLVLSHHPIRSSIAIHDAPPRPTRPGEWTTTNAWVHMDAELIEPLFNLHGNVRLCLSGHMHRRDRLIQAGVTHLGAGALCGDLWRSPGRPDRPESLMLLRLYDNGTFEHAWLDLAEVAAR